MASDRPIPPLPAGGPPASHRPEADAWRPLVAAGEPAEDLVAASHTPSPTDPQRRITTEAPTPTAAPFR